MGKFALVVLWALYFCRGLEGTSGPFSSLEETSIARGRGLCSTWGNGAFRTFDNVFYHFTSTCNYILSRHCRGGTEDFNIQIRRGPDGNLEHVFIQIEGVKVLIVNGTITVQDVLVSLPHNNKVLGIYKHGVNTRFSNRKHTISVNWNSNDALWVHIDDIYQGQLCGLCGEFVEYSSTVYDATFLDANKLDVLGHTCYSNPSSESTCSAITKCQLISSLFLSCYETHVTTKYWSLCQEDVCNCKTSRCECAFFEEMARRCNGGRNNMWKNWRTEAGCAPPTCPRNQVYKECGSAFIPTCTDPNPHLQCDQCVSTCVCPEGHLLDNIRGSKKCVSKNECPCEYGGQFYNSGDIRNTPCQSCTCKHGSWSCSLPSCPGTCTIEEATYFTTFDNNYYSIIGDCSYYAVVTNSWTIKVDIRQCQAVFQQSCLQRVILTTNQTTYVFSNDGKVYSNGQAIGIPVKTGEIIIFQKSSMFIQVATTFGLKMQVQTAPVMQLYISLPVYAKGTTKGLCGTFNGEAEDDFLSEQGILESCPITFADSWKTDGSCPEPKIPVPCVSSENENYAKLYCSQLKDPASVFSVCHSTVDYLKYYHMCVAATCACENINDCLCAALGTYVHDCAANGVIVRKWTENICNQPCTTSHVFDNDMRACNRTCRSLAVYDYTCEVKDAPVFGCGCPEGKYMDGTGACVDKLDCPCYIGDMVVNKGQSITLSGRNCQCENGKLHCPVVPTPDRECQNGKVYNDCFKTSVNKQSCRNRNIPQVFSLCIPGCVCPDNLVEDDSGRCIRPEQCPCVFGGEQHPPGKTIQRDCNQCTCNAGIWKCTTNSCPKTCHVHGDGQYITFDGKRYMFDGNCEYILVEDHCNQREGTFQILIESVPCCENGVTCSRNIKILFAEVEFLLTDGRVVRTDKSRQAQCRDNSYSFHTVGLYLILSFSNGIIAIWDRHTRFSITLDPRWKNEVCGLCGNFNDDVADDLKTKGNSLVTNAVKFGNSWKSSLSCSDILNQTFPCDRNPYCLAWAQRRCSILKDVVFQNCHKKVDPVPYFDACVEEACACDMEGKYLGFCTAVAVYAEACNKAGVCINWRTPDLCPVYCDYYNTPGECSWHYHPCGTIKTRTCSDHHIGKKYSAVLEGCYARCPENTPYLDENKMKCVNLPNCTCYYNGKILLPGSRTMNDCEECVCKNGKVICRALTTTTEIISSTLSTPTVAATTIETTTTTTTTKVPPTTTTTTTTKVPPTTSSTIKSTTEGTCIGGWSAWFNGHTPSPDSPGDTELLESIGQDLCPSIYYTINKVECQFANYPQWPISESPDNVTCDPDIGLVCRVTQEPYKPKKLCLDYKIRFCCEPRPTPTPRTTPTTTFSETTTTTNVPPTTTSTSSYTTEGTCIGGWSAWFNGHTPSPDSPGDTELLESIGQDLCPSIYYTINKVECQFANYPQWPISESPDNVTCDPDIGLVCRVTQEPYEPKKLCLDYKIRFCCEPRPTPTPRRTPTTTFSETTTTTNVPPTTTSTSSYTTEGTCIGGWSAWFNGHTPSPDSPGDTELLESIGQDLCPSIYYTINKVECQFANYPQWPISESPDNVTCDPDIGLVCRVTQEPYEPKKLCLDYKIRFCCEPRPTPTPRRTPTTTFSETTTTTNVPPTTTSTSSYTTEGTCIGGWSAWFNGHTPSPDSPGDTELLESIGQDLCPSIYYTINKVECQFANYPQWPISESPDNVTCDPDIGLVCRVTQEPYEPKKLCLDYKIRFCCEPRPTPTPRRTPTTTFSETTTTTNVPPTTTSTSSYTTEGTCIGGWSAWFNGHTPSPDSPGDTELLESIGQDLCPSIYYTINKVECQFANYPQWPISESPDNVTCDPDIGLVCRVTQEPYKPKKLCLDYKIRFCCEPRPTPTPRTTPTTTFSETTTTTTTNVPPTTTSTSSYTTEGTCIGGWSAWFNGHTPSPDSPGDTELLESIGQDLCPSIYYTINKVECQFANYPQWPISESPDNVTCDPDIGLVCRVTQEPYEPKKLCLDYKIRFCCEPRPTPTPRRTPTTTFSETTTTTNVPPTTTSTSSYTTEGTCIGGWSAWFNGHTPSPDSPGDTELLESIGQDLCPSIYYTINKVECQFANYPQWPISESPDNVTCDPDIGLVCRVTQEPYKPKKLCLDYKIRFCCEPRPTPTPRTTPTTTFSETTTTTTTNVPPTTTSTSSYTTEGTCIGGWSAWFNGHTPSPDSPGDTELLESIGQDLCPSIYYTINKVECQFANYPQWPISESPDNVTCDPDIGLVCRVTQEPYEPKKLCLDYKIRFCCEPRPTPTPRTTPTTTFSETTTTTTTNVPPTTTSTSSYTTEGTCIGGWSAWFNGHTPSPDSPGDTELLESIGQDLCPSIYYTINKVECQFANYPQWPISESPDNVTCDPDIGLVCRVTQEPYEPKKLCLDYKIRFCCEPRPTPTPRTTPTTTFSETTTTTTTNVPPTTTSTSSYTTEGTCIGGWSAWFNGHTPSPDSPGDTELLESIGQDLCPSIYYTINKVECQFANYPQWPISESPDNVTCDPDIGLVCRVTQEPYEPKKLCLDYKIRFCCEPRPTPTPRRTPTTTFSETTTTTNVPPTTTSTSSYTTETTLPTTKQTTTTPSYKPGTTTTKLPPTTTSTSTYTTVECQFSNFPEWPISESPDNVTCDPDIGLVCRVTKEPLKVVKLCLDYQIRFCCEPLPTPTPYTTSTTVSETPTTTTTTKLLPTTTSTSTYTTEGTCYGGWSAWYNDHTPSPESPDDTELLESIRQDVCPSIYYKIYKVECQFSDFPEWPISESPDNVTCDPDIGLVCRVTKEPLKEVKLCLDYQIRFCCEPLPTPTSCTTSTTFSEITSTTMTTPTTMPTTTTTKTTTMPTTRTTMTTMPTTWLTTTTITPTTTTTTPTTTTTTTTMTTPTTTTTRTMPTTTTTTTTPTTTTTTTPTTTTTTPTTTTTTPTTTTITTATTTTTISSTSKRHPTVTTATSYPVHSTTTELFCDGEWSHWFNYNTPSIEDKGDYELLEELPPHLCPFFPYKISDINCEAVKFPQQPISKTEDIVTCDRTKGLICNYTDQSPKDRLMCLDYRIRVCCERKHSTTTIIPTIYEPPITKVTYIPPESCFCYSNPPRKCLESWQDNCTIVTCLKGNLFKIDPVVCPELGKPTCGNNMEPVKVRTENGCCEQWECDCECEVWGDPHYNTFGGLSYDFFDNCTYTLVEEKIPKYNFSVLVDNYFCIPFIKNSCPKGLIISYNGNVVHISTGEEYMLTVNGIKVKLPYNSKGFSITKLGSSTRIFIPDIRTVIDAFRHAFKIRIPEKYFFNNTQGQCGSCSTDQCTRKNGKVEPSDCCHKTAFDWKVDDLSKPYCDSAPTNVPCIPPPPPPTCPSVRTICDLIRGEPFRECRSKIDLERFVKSCVYDHCVLNSTADCSSLEAAALACASVGVCVDWRNSTNGKCTYTCDEGLVYKPCARNNSDYCEHNVVKAGETFNPAEEGCFCPDGLVFSEDRSKCVPFCESCHDYLGRPRKIGETWEDPTDPCISYSCTLYGVLIRNQSCIHDETCPESQRAYVNRCCFRCIAQGYCAINKFNETITKGNCKATLIATQCQGHCPSSSRYDFKRNRMDNFCECCKAAFTEKMSLKLRCKNGGTKRIKYTAIKSCKCQNCGKR